MPVRPHLASLVASAVALAPLGAWASEPSPASPPPPAGTVALPIPEPVAGRLAEAERAFAVQDYPSVIARLEALSGHPALVGRPEHRQLLEWLGASHWFAGNRDAARLALGALLRESPFHVLDRFVYPPELIDDFELLRASLAGGGVIPGRPAEPGSAPRTILRISERNTTPTLAYFAPLAVGQFANGELGKGALLASLQGLGAATMLATWLGVESLKVDGTDRVRPSDGGPARALDALWYAGFALLAGSWIWSVADGFVYRDDRPRTLEERVLEPTPPVSLHLRPALSPVAGALHWPGLAP